MNEMVMPYKKAKHVQRSKYKKEYYMSRKCFIDNINN